MQLQKSAVGAAVVCLVAACGHKPSNPVAISQPGDTALTCQQIESQMTANRHAANTLAGLDSDREATNTAAMVASAVVFWPAVFAIDLSNTEQIEMRALQDRNQNLARMHGKKQC